MNAKIRELNLDEVKNVAGGAIVSATAVLRPTTISVKPTVALPSAPYAGQMFMSKLV